MKRIKRLTKFAAFIAGIAIIITFLVVGAVHHWAWAGFDKPLYDWMQLLIIPVALALIAVWFNRIDKKNELAIAQKRADDERALALDNQQEAALQGYLDRMQALLLDKGLRESKSEDEVRNVARVRTLTMFYQVNTRRTNYMLSFLRESGLIAMDEDQNIVTFTNTDLRHADLHEVGLYDLDLSGANLSGANLSGTFFWGANLSRANLSETHLSETHLSGTNLSGANLSKANLSGANLSGANLSGANLSGANLSGANLSDANLSSAFLFKANLSKANLSKANLNSAELFDANLIGADLSGAELFDAELSGAKIDKVSLDKASITKKQTANLNIISP